MLLNKNIYFRITLDDQFGSMSCRELAYRETDNHGHWTSRHRRSHETSCDVRLTTQSFPVLAEGTGNPLHLNTRNADTSAFATSAKALTGVRAYMGY